VLGENEVMLRQVPAMLNAADLKHSMNQFIEKIQSYPSPDVAVIAEVLLERMLDEDFSNSPAEWNQFLRELEQLGDIAALYHQISEQDLSKWFS
jgi:hypothetical protein